MWLEEVNYGTVLINGWDPIYCPTYESRSIELLALQLLSKLKKKVVACKSEFTLKSSSMPYNSTTHTENVLLLACLVCVIKILTLSLHKWFLNVAAAVVSLIVCMIVSMCTVIMYTLIQQSSSSVNVTSAQVLYTCCEGVISLLCCLHELIATSLFFYVRAVGINVIPFCVTCE